MDCKEFEKLIPDFLEHKLDFLTMGQFNKHKEECASCKEELVIHFLVTEGIQRLEEGDAFDLQKELSVHLEEAERKIKKHNRIIRFGEIWEIVAVLILIAVMVWVIV